MFFRRRRRGLRSGILAPQQVTDRAQRECGHEENFAVKGGDEGVNVDDDDVVDEVEDEGVCSVFDGKFCCIVAIADGVEEENCLKGSRFGF